MVADVATTLIAIIAGTAIAAEVIDLEKKRKERAATPEKSGESCPLEPDNSCKVSQNKLLERARRLLALKSYMSGFQYAGAARLFNIDVEAHNAKCLFNQVDKLPLN